MIRGKGPLSSGQFSLQRGPARDAAEGKKLCIFSAQETQTQRWFLCPNSGSLCNRPQQAQGREGASSGLSRTSVPHCRPPRPLSVPAPSTQGRCQLKLADIQESLQKNRVGPWATDCLPACHLLEKHGQMSSSACVGRSYGHSARDAGRLREPARGWAPAVAPSRRLLGWQVWRSVEDGGGARVTSLALFLSWGCRSKSTQSGQLKISAVCSLPARRPEVHNQSVGRAVAFLGAVGRTLPAPLGISWLASVSPWSLPPSSPHSGPLPRVPVSTFLSSCKDSSH